MTGDFTFPFGQKLRTVEQTDRSPKQVFVLGVYASAVHARWLDANGQLAVQALAVASEPYIFWRGEDADDIVGAIHVPPALGRLTPAGRNLNGPSGRALDELFLHPLGCDRSDAWLCDLVPHACLNEGQRKAIRDHYAPLVQEFDLPQASIPPVPSYFADDSRRLEIVREIEEAQPRLIVLLGDQPIRWFLSSYTGFQRLSDFGTRSVEYGQAHACTINDKLYRVLPLVHPRQAGGLGFHSTTWRERHLAWMRQRAPEIGREHLGG
jgi:uracil-DNA glycosylase